MALTPKFKQKIKAHAHGLRPLIYLGHQGLTDAVKKETDRALTDHEVIKVRIQSDDREHRRELFKELCTSLKAELVQVIGCIGVLYRESEKEK